MAGGTLTAPPDDATIKRVLPKLEIHKDMHNQEGWKRLRDDLKVCEQCGCDGVILSQGDDCDFGTFIKIAKAMKKNLLKNGSDLNVIITSDQVPTQAAVVAAARSFTPDEVSLDGVWLQNYGYEIGNAMGLDIPSRKNGVDLSPDYNGLIGEIDKLHDSHWKTPIIFADIQCPADMDDRHCQKLARDYIADQGFTPLAVQDDMIQRKKSAALRLEKADGTFGIQNIGAAFRSSDIGNMHLFNSNGIIVPTDLQDETGALKRDNLARLTNQAGLNDFSEINAPWRNNALDKRGHMIKTDYGVGSSRIKAQSEGMVWDDSHQWKPATTQQPWDRTKQTTAAFRTASGPARDADGRIDTVSFRAAILQSQMKNNAPKPRSPRGLGR